MKVFLVFLYLGLCHIIFAQNDDNYSFRRNTSSIEIISFPNSNIEKTSVHNIKLNYIHRIPNGNRIYLGAGYQNSLMSPRGSVLFENDSTTVGRNLTNSFYVHSLDFSTAYEFGIPFNNKNNLWLGPYIGVSMPFQKSFHTENPDEFGLFTTDASVNSNPSLQFGANISWQYRLKKNSIEFLIRFKTYQKLNSSFEANLTGFSPTSLKLIEPRGFLGIGLRYTFL